MPHLLLLRVCTLVHCWLGFPDLRSALLLNECRSPSGWMATPSDVSPLSTGCAAGMLLRAAVHSASARNSHGGFY